VTAGTVEEQLRRLPPDLAARYVVDQRDREGWAAARTRAIGASEAAKFAKLDSVPLYVRGKLHNPFMGNMATSHGNQREEHILAQYHVPQNTLMFRSALNPRFVATPDGITVGADGTIILTQVKTTDHPFKTIPLGYRRQIWWEQYVIGADRTLFVWEEHEDFHPVSMEPESCWIDRDEHELAKMLAIGGLVLAALDDYDQFTKETAA
jgi:hypothetical protein